MILRGMLKHSTNLTAEVTGLAASGGREFAGVGFGDAGMGAAAPWGFGADRGPFGAGRQLADFGGGYGARAGRGVQDGMLPGLLKPHGMRDGKGKLIQGIRCRFWRKPGTLNFVSSLAGYIQRPRRAAAGLCDLCRPVMPRRAALAEAERERPAGGEAWLKRARALQAQLVSRWAGLYA